MYSCDSLCFGIEVDHRLGLLVRFLDLHRRRQVGLQHRQAFVDQLLHHLLRQIGARLELVDHDAFHPQVAVVVGLDLLHVLQQRIQRLARELVAVEGDQAGIGGDQRRAGEEVQRRRGVDEHAVEASASSSSASRSL
jgi:hypothetical protein